MSLPTEQPSDDEFDELMAAEHSGGTIPPLPAFSVLPPHELALTTKEIAQRLRCSVRTIFNYRESGQIPAIKINSRKYLYEWEKVVSALAERRTA